MLFLIAIAVVMYALALTGLDFVRSLSLAIAGLTTTGPAMRGARRRRRLRRAVGHRAARSSAPR